MIKFLYADTFDYLLRTHLGVLELFVAQKLRKKQECFFFFTLPQTVEPAI